MKAIIVEIKGKYAAVLSDDGVVSKIKNRSFYLGQEIVIKNNSNKLIRIAASAAAAIMIFVTPAWAYLTPYSYVSLDVNPSFEFSINRFDRVLTVKAVNDDGEELSKNIDISGLKNKEIQSAVRSVLNELKNQGYIIEGEEGGVIVATSSKTQDKTDMLSEKIRNAVNEEVAPRQEPENNEAELIKKPEKHEKPEKPEKHEKPDKSKDSEKSAEIKETETNTETGDFTDEKPEKSEKPGEPERTEKPEKSDKPNKSENAGKPDKSNEQSKKHKEKFDVNIIEVTEKEVDEAKKLGVTPGKLNLVDKLQKAAESAGHEIEAVEWLDESVQKINAKIKEYKEEAKQKEGNKNTSSDKSNNGNVNDNNKGRSNNGKGNKH